MAHYIKNYNAGASIHIDCLFAVSRHTRRHRVR